jgi:hypothetical protein
MILVQFFRTSLALSGMATAVPLALYVWTKGLDDAWMSWTGWSAVGLIASFFLTRHALPRHLFRGERASARVGESEVERKLVGTLFALPMVFMFLASAVVILYDDALSRIGWMVIAMAVSAGRDLEGLHRVTWHE